MTSDGTLAARYDFDPYGKRLTQYQSSAYIGGCDLGFTGHLTLPSIVAGQTEMVLTHFRSYDPQLGRWLSADPMERVTGQLAEMLPEGPNLYAYVDNNPLNSSDPNGLGKIGLGFKIVNFLEKKAYKNSAEAYMIFLARWARHLSWKTTAEMFNASWDAVFRSVKWVVEWGLEHRDLLGVIALGVDELHWGRGKKGGNFLTLI